LAQCRRAQVVAAHRPVRIRKAPRAPLLVATK
jgi:hypothetical protein